jgi:hypothetical protein
MGQKWAANGHDGFGHDRTSHRANAAQWPFLGHGGPSHAASPAAAAHAPDMARPLDAKKKPGPFLIRVDMVNGTGLFCARHYSRETIRRVIHDILPCRVGAIAPATSVMQAPNQTGIRFQYLSNVGKRPFPVCEGHTNDWRTGRILCVQKKHDATPFVG